MRPGGLGVYSGVQVCKRAYACIVVHTGCIVLHTGLLTAQWLAMSGLLTAQWRAMFYARDVPISSAHNPPPEI